MNGFYKTGSGQSKYFLPRRVERKRYFEKYLLLTSGKESHLSFKKLKGILQGQNLSLLDKFLILLFFLFSFFKKL